MTDTRRDYVPPTEQSVGGYIFLINSLACISSFRLPSLSIYLNLSLEVSEHKALLEASNKGHIQEIVVTHRDRLCRFGFELVEWIIQSRSNGTVLVLDKKETSPEQELVGDLISIVTVFSSRLYGLRQVKNKIIQATKCKIQDSEIETISNTTTAS